ncbi:MAG: hypothetical protein AMXMBFR48_20680 [Ignavibacteriales bacterium]
MVIAVSIGKNSPNTGKRSVPSPNPEKNVSAEPAKAVRQIIIYSIFDLSFRIACFYAERILFNNRNL